MVQQFSTPFARTTFKPELRPIHHTPFARLARQQQTYRASRGESICIVVHLIAFDFSRAFDTVSHSSLVVHISGMQIPDYIYNWIVIFLEDRDHRNTFNGATSPVMYINSSTVQGWCSGLINFLVGLTISVVKTTQTGNSILKYADDCYLLIPSVKIIPCRVPHGSVLGPLLFLFLR